MSLLRETCRALRVTGLRHILSCSMQPGVMQLRNLTVKVTEDLAHLAVRHIAQFKAVEPVCTGGAVNGYP